MEGDPGRLGSARNVDATAGWRWLNSAAGRAETAPTAHQHPAAIDQRATRANRPQHPVGAGQKAVGELFADPTGFEPVSPPCRERDLRRMPPRSGRDRRPAGRFRARGRSPAPALGEDIPAGLDDLLLVPRHGPKPDRPSPDHFLLSQRLEPRHAEQRCGVQQVGEGALVTELDRSGRTTHSRCDVPELTPTSSSLCRPAVRTALTPTGSRSVPDRPSRTRKRLNLGRSRPAITCVSSLRERTLLPDQHLQRGPHGFIDAPRDLRSPATPGWTNRRTPPQGVRSTRGNGTRGVRAR